VLYKNALEVSNAYGAHRFEFKYYTPKITTSVTSTSTSTTTSAATTSTSTTTATAASTTTPTVLTSDFELTLKTTEDSKYDVYIVANSKNPYTNDAYYYTDI